VRAFATMATYVFRRYGYANAPYLFTNVTIVGYLGYQCFFITVLAFATMVTYVFGRYCYANAP
jgi:hypothetical protein